MTPCQTCHGKRMMVCPACGGAPHRFGARDLCGACGGAGAIKCPTCGNTGHLPGSYKGFIPVRERRHGRGKGRGQPHRTQAKFRNVEPFEMPLFVLSRVPGCLVTIVMFALLVGCLYYVLAPALVRLVGR